MSNAVYIGVDNIARKVKKMYTGIVTEVPIYESTIVTKEYPLNLANIDRYFTVSTTNTSNGWDYTDYNSGGLHLSPKNFSSNSTTASITLTAKTNLSSVILSGAYSAAGTFYNNIKLVEVAGVSKISSSSTSFDYKTIWTGSLSEGQTISLSFQVIMSSSSTNASNTYFTLNCDAFSETVEEQTVVGYETLPVARKVKKGYIGVNGIARQFFSFYEHPFVSYSGNYTVTNIEDNDKTYELYTLTTSGTLVLKNNVDYWMCGGGGCGAQQVYSSKRAASGGGGGGGYMNRGLLSAKSYVVTIGAGSSKPSTSLSEVYSGASTVISSDDEAFTAAGGESAAASTSTATNSAIAKGGNGGSGGAPGQYTANETGSSTTRGAGGLGTGTSDDYYPFKITSLFAHCAGGGSGMFQYTSGSSISYKEGCTGGSLGSDYVARTISSPSGTTFGLGGEKGGGNGGMLGSGMEAGGDGTFYGAGGGGGSSLLQTNATTNFQRKTSGTYGTGYQGVVYLLIPV